MQRRNFIKLLTGASLATGFGLPAFSKEAMAAGGFQGPYYLNLQLNGGIDQSSWADPRANSSINHYDGSKIGKVAGTNIRYAPLSNNKQIFDAHGKDMLVFNGVTVGVSHTAGRIWQTTGKISKGYPSLESLYATIRGEGLLIPWLLRTGGDAQVGGLTPYTAVRGKVVGGLLKPNKMGVSGGDTGYYLPPSVVDMIKSTQNERLKAMQTNSRTLPRVKAVVDNFLTAGLGTKNAENVTSIDSTTTYDDGNGRDNGIAQAIKLFAAGLTASATIGTMGWDTHKNHDADGKTKLTELAQVIDYIWTHAANEGITDKLVLHISSDVGRTPHYNAAAGKDHFHRATCMVIAKNKDWTGRMVGMTGAKHEATKINKTTLQKDPNGLLLNAAHVQQTLREILGIDQHAIAKKFPLGVESFAALDPNVESPIII